MKKEGPQIAEVSTREIKGKAIAGVLASAWRVTSDPPTFSETQLAAVTPQLYQTGAAALAWWRIRSSSLAATPTGQQFHDAYKQLRLAARVHEQEIKYVLSLMRAEDIEPVLVKGWAIARRYPDAALRPYGDIDLCVAPDRFAQAQRMLKGLGEREGHHVDLHNGFTKFGGSQTFHRRGLSEASQEPGATNNKYFASKHRQDDCATWDELFGRSQVVMLGETQVRVLADEDHLRVLCLHLLRSGAWRPLWLCDVAVALESREPDFNWEQCLGPDRRLAEWIACAIGLAHELLGADVADIEATHITQRARCLPRWLVPAVLRQWSRGVNPDTLTPALPSLLGQLTQPPKLISELYQRLDHPVRATATLRGRFNNWPRLPYQLGELLLRIREVPKQLSMTVRQRRLNKSKTLAIPTSGLMMNLTSDR